MGPSFSLAYLFGSPGPMELLIIGIIILLLFGNRLPSVMRSLGRGVVEFKKGLQGIEDGENTSRTSQESESSKSSSTTNA
jgi:sec-independent protein translocase protein TatA